MLIILIMIGMLSALVAVYVFIFKAFGKTIKYAAFIIPCFLAFAWGPTFIHSFFGKWYLDGVLYALLSTIVLFGIYSVEQLAIPTILLVYSSIFYTFFAMWKVNRVVYFVVVILMLLLGTVFSLGMIKPICNRRCRPWPLIIVFRVIAYPIYLYMAFLLQTVYIHGCIKNPPEVWKQLCKEPMQLGIIDKSTPYIWIPFVIALIFSVIGLIIDIRYSLTNKGERI